MPRFHFTEDFDFRPQARGGAVTIAYKAGMTKMVNSECAKAAKAKGRGHVVKKTDKDGQETDGR